MAKPKIWRLLMGVIMILTQGCGGFDGLQKKQSTDSLVRSAALTSKPNILMIMLDDAGQGDWINPSIAPNIGKFREQATHFPSFYTSPMCAPTRISMLSGRSHADYSILWVCGSNAIYGIPNSDATIPQSLAKRGYRTTTIGKWHASVKDTKKAAETFPPAIEYGPDQKFQNYIISQPVMADGYFDPVMDVKGIPTKFKGHQTDIQGDQVVNRVKDLAKNPDKPFYLQYWLNAPHAPLTPAPRMFANATQRAEYEKHLANRESSNATLRKAANQYFSDNKHLLYKKLLGQADQNIGKVLDLIKNSSDPFLKNTIVLITSDNGGTKDTRGSTDPYGNIDYLGRDLRGFKTDVFEGGIRQNLLIKMPGQTTKRVDNTALSVMDLFPTYLDLVGSYPTKQELNQFDGQSFAARLLDQKVNFNREKALYWPFKVKNEHVDTTEGYDSMSFAIRKGRWKLVVEPLDDCRPCLFDFQSGYNNESKESDLAEAYPTLVKELRENYIEWYLSTTQLPSTVAEKSTGVKQQNRVIEGFKKDGPGEVVRDYDFTTSSGKQYVKLNNNIKFDVNRLDFTVSAKITPDRVNVEQVISMRKGTWRFEISADGYLQVSTRSRNGDWTTVKSSAKLTAGNSYDVGFTIYSFKSLNTVVRIFARDHNADLDDEERLIRVARQETSAGLASNDNTIHVGADPTSAHVSMQGLVEDFRIYHSPLMRAEIGYGQRWWGNKFD